MTRRPPPVACYDHRMRPAAVALAASLVLGLSGCVLYVANDDAGDDDGCLGPPARLLRDPASGQCQSFGGGCGPQALAEPDWAACGGPCDGLDQASCQAAAGCRAIFVDTCPQCDGLALAYAGCWGTAPSGPIQGGGCVGLDAQACSRHDDCAAVHLGLEAPAGDGGFTGAIGGFSWCEPEWSPSPFPCGELTCSAGQYCAVTYPGIPDAPVQYACADLPAACADLATACACLADAGVCVNGCDLDAAGNLTASCYLP